MSNTKIFLFLCVFFYQISFGQSISLSNNCYKTFDTKYLKDISSINELPVKIQEVLNQSINQRLNGFKNSLKFINGVEYNLDSIVELKDIQFLSKREILIPQYELIYSLKINQLQATVCIKVLLDQYGQILRFDWPEYRYDSDRDIAYFFMIEKRALNYAKEKNYQINKYTYTLYYSESSGKVYYLFSFLQKEEEVKKARSTKKAKEYRLIAIDINSDGDSKQAEKSILYDELRTVSSMEGYD